MTMITTKTARIKNASTIKATMKIEHQDHEDQASECDQGDREDQAHQYGTTSQGTQAV
jgi:hypothetical protein